MPTTLKPQLTELAEKIQSLRADLEEILIGAQPLLHRHCELLESYADVSEEFFVDLCEKDGYLAFADALARLRNVAGELDARAFVGRHTTSSDLLRRPLLAS